MAALRTNDAHELSWEYAATTPVDKYNARSLVGAASGSVSKTRGRRKFRGGNLKGGLVEKMDSSDEEIDIKKTVYASSLAMKSSKKFGPKPSLKLKRNFCRSIEHVKASCHLNPENPNK